MRSSTAKSQITKKVKNPQHRDQVLEDLGGVWPAEQSAQRGANDERQQRGHRDQSHGPGEGKGDPVPDRLGKGGDGVAKVALEHAHPKVDVLPPQGLVDPKLFLVLLDPRFEFRIWVQQLLVVQVFDDRVAGHQARHDKGERVGDKDDRQELEKP
jgi:hypothetical protein